MLAPGIDEINHASLIGMEDGTSVQGRPGEKRLVAACRAIDRIVNGEGL